jgi:hypothetical protein
MMEKQGIPALVICTEPFVSSGKAMALAHGFPDYPFEIVPHPINVTPNEVLDQWVENSFPRIVGLLLKGGLPTPISKSQ